MGWMSLSLHGADPLFGAINLVIILASSRSEVSTHASLKKTVCKLMRCEEMTGTGVMALGRIIEGVSCCSVDQSGWVVRADLQIVFFAVTEKRVEEIVAQAALLLHLARYRN